MEVLVQMGGCKRVVSVLLMLTWSRKHYKKYNIYHLLVKAKLNHKELLLVRCKHISEAVPPVSCTVTLCLGSREDKEVA